MKERETFASRLGFVLISAGCAIGLGNGLAVPLHRGAVRRRGLCADLSAVPGHHGPAHHGHGVFRGPGQPEEHPGLLSGPGAQGEQVHWYGGSAWRAITC